jgi:hypothetical protein
MNSDPIVKRELLRHTVATLAYRAGKTLRDAPVCFGTFRINDGTRTPVEILAHIGDLLEWALWLAKGKHVWKDAAPQSWEAEVTRVFQTLHRLDVFLASDTTIGFAPEKLFQGPIADALTHVGQIAMLRRLAGAPVRGENYFKADIAAGRVGPDQTAARREFE